MFPATVLKVLIATPGDTGEEVEAVIKNIHSWNSRRAEAEGVILLPRHWKSDTVPVRNAEGGQAAVNSQIVDDADIVVAVFDSRLGSATMGAVSGTAHEIERTTEAGKPAHVYFSDEPVSRSVDPEELLRLNNFRAEMEAKGLVGVYADPTDLGYQVREAIEHDLTQMNLGVAELPIAAPPEHAMPRLRYISFHAEALPSGQRSCSGSHDLRHTFAVLQLSAGVHFLQVSKWLGHSTFTLTLDVYGDYIPEEDGRAANTLPEPPLPVSPAGTTGTVVLLRRQTS
jgi:hypothetical protein